MATKVVIVNKLKLKEYSKRARFAVNAMLKIIAKDIEGKAALIVRPHKYSGNLLRDLTSERFEEDGRNSLGIDFFVKSSSSQYGQVIHDQRDFPSKMPPFEAIQEWVAVKLGIPIDSEYSWPVTQAIRKNISERGMESIGPDGLEFFWKPLFENRDKYTRDIAAACERIKM